jgi:hypothetical protein
LGLGLGLDLGLDLVRIQVSIPRLVVVAVTIWGTLSVNGLAASQIHVLGRNWPAVCVSVSIRVVSVKTAIAIYIAS